MTTIAPDRLTTPATLDAIADRLGKPVVELDGWLYVVDDSRSVPLIYMARQTCDVPLCTAQAVSFDETTGFRLRGSCCGGFDGDAMKAYRIFIGVSVALAVAAFVAAVTFGYMAVFLHSETFGNAAGVSCLVAFVLGVFAALATPEV